MLKRMAKINPMAKYAMMAVGIMLVIAGVEFIFRRALENAQPEQAFTYSFIVSVVYSFLIVFMIAIVWMAAQEFSAKKDGGLTVQLSDTSVRKTESDLDDILKQKAESGGFVIGPIPPGASEDTQAALSKLFAAKKLFDASNQIEVVITEDAEKAYFKNLNISRSGWNEGYLVQIGDAWYYTDIGRENHSALPTFIRTRADAEEFIAEANHWFVEGHRTGKECGWNDAKEELRKWLD